jgi:hypothetical protein
MKNFDKKDATAKNTVSDKADRKKAAELVKADLMQNVPLGGNARGTVIDESPIVPVALQIYCKWNIKESKIVGIETKNNMAQMIDPYMTVIGVGPNVQTVNIGDRFYIKEDAGGQIQAVEIEDYKFHVCYENIILGLVK